ncbi:uncharacterized protein LOC117316864 [Pecten maximus]|uniref:uncharacterized protein LOC117316864 n=1 Tax=Pecten maximus TaxID=6579 RepID=UPI001458065C|nr:uncharacterized protein LOC117316864 [Pecten maximus]
MILPSTRSFLLTLTVGWCCLEEFPSSYLDRTGHLGIRSTAKFFMNAAFLAFRNGYFDRANIDNDYTHAFFLVSQSLRLSNHLYCDIVRLSSSDLLVASRAAAVGRTSMTNLYILSCADTKVELARCVTALVMTNVDTRRPTPLPKWFKVKHTSATSANFDLLQNEVKTSREFQQVPEECFRSEVKTRYSDTDFNNHVNQTEYIQFCLEGVEEASQSGYYRHFTSDILLYPVLEFDIIHLGESRACEILTVSTWQDKTNDQLVHFSIHNKSSSKCVAVATIKFGSQSLRTPASSSL